MDKKHKILTAITGGLLIILGVMVIRTVTPEGLRSEVLSDSGTCSGLLINEYQIRSFIELKNTTSKTVSLDGYSIIKINENFGGSISGAIDLDGLKIAANGLFTIGSLAMPIADLVVDDFYRVGFGDEYSIALVRGDASRLLYGPLAKDAVCDGLMTTERDLTNSPLEYEYEMAKLLSPGYVGKIKAVINGHTKYQDSVGRNATHPGVAQNPLSFELGSPSPGQENNSKQPQLVIKFGPLDLWRGWGSSDEDSSALLEGKIMLVSDTEPLTPLVAQTPLTVTLRSSDPTELSVSEAQNGFEIPSTTVTIPAGQSEVRFTAKPVDDMWRDGGGAVYLYATAEGATPFISQIVIGEHGNNPHYDPFPKLAISEVYGYVFEDTNGDGKTNIDDQFVEIVNMSSERMDLTGYRLDVYENGAWYTRHTWDNEKSNILVPGQAMVVYSSSQDTLISGVVVGSSSSGQILQLPQGQAYTSVRLLNAAGREESDFSYKIPSPNTTIMSNYPTLNNIRSASPGRKPSGKPFTRLSGDLDSPYHLYLTDFFETANTPVTYAWVKSSTLWCDSGEKKDPYVCMASDGNKDWRCTASQPAPIVTRDICPQERFMWNTNNWSSCQADGKQTKKPLCYRERVGSQRSLVDESLCPIWVDKKPQVPLVRDCTYSWQVSSWGACVMGKKQRTVNCIGSDYRTAINETLCTQPKPDTSSREGCPAPTSIQWEYGRWGDCRPSGSQTRSISCKIDGMYAPDAECASIMDQREPAEQACVFEYKYEWVHGDFSVCQNGVKTRTATCHKFSKNLSPGVDLGPVENSFCTMPNYTSETCYDIHWEYGPYGPCQSNGTQTRTATCKKYDYTGRAINTVGNSLCSFTIPAITTQSCTYTPPTPAVCRVSFDQPGWYYFTVKNPLTVSNLSWFANTYFGGDDAGLASEIHLGGFGGKRVFYSPTDSTWYDADFTDASTVSVGTQFIVNFKKSQGSTTLTIPTALEYNGYVSSTNSTNWISNTEKKVCE